MQLVATPEVELEVVGPATHRSVLDGLERTYPMLRGTTRTTSPRSGDHAYGSLPVRKICRTLPQMARRLKQSRRARSR